MLGFEKVEFADSLISNSLISDSLISDDLVNDDLVNDDFLESGEFSLGTLPVVETRVLPFIKWAGGKRWAAEHLTSLMPARYGRYFEPFMGGSALFFHTRPDHAMLSDTNMRLVKLYRGVRDGVEDVIGLLSTYRRSEAFYYEMREWSKLPASGEKSRLDKLSDVEVAAWFLYMNRTCVNGLYRENKKGEFNVSFGSYPESQAFYNSEQIRRASAVLRGKTINRCDFRFIEAEAKTGDFVYFDPPYVPLTTTSHFTRYSKGGFSEQDQRDLSELFFRLKEKGVHVILTNSSADLVYELYKDAKIEAVDARRSINSDASKRGVVKELIIY